MTRPLRQPYVSALATSESCRKHGQEVNSKRIRCNVIHGSLSRCVVGWNSNSTRISIQYIVSLNRCTRPPFVLNRHSKIRISTESIQTAQQVFPRVHAPSSTS
ncbi:hypothetical protein SeLEV6574_g08583 [Synchytrium endobioticum]|uniref:Uncharacterized protein n=1 Tax=Synchytrium endobioticum TaxID=286115 RepID=A0A507BMG9_9FUNG|nr:hypothetical protein SeLEV6574_g08583 [Synchytrium endobioticum]